MSAGGWGLLVICASVMGIIALAYVRLCERRPPAAIDWEGAAEFGEGARHTVYGDPGFKWAWLSHPDHLQMLHVPSADVDAYRALGWRDLT